MSHLTLALAGVCMTCAELPYLPELPLGLLLYLALVWLSWRTCGRLTVSTWLANLFGLVIAGGAGLWVMARLGEVETTWARDIPLPAMIVPYLGPVLMALLVVRLFRPPSRSDREGEAPAEPGARGSAGASPSRFFLSLSDGNFWSNQGLGLLQVALGCVLASGTLFGICLLCYLVCAVCALVLHQKIQAGRGHGTPEESALPQGDILRLRWLASQAALTGGIALLAVPLFLLTPRLDGPDWDPLGRFGVQRGRISARTGFSEEIDLNRVGVLEKDDGIAFTVQVMDHRGRPVQALPPEPRWRGLVLDRYDEGVWRGESEVSWPRGVPVLRPGGKLESGPDRLSVHFQVPRRTGGLFLAEPVVLGPRRGDLPVVAQEHPGAPQPPLFFEAGGTVVPLTYLVNPEYRYTQALSRNGDQQRSPARRVSEPYRRKLMLARVADLDPWAVDLLERLARQSAERSKGLPRSAGPSANSPDSDEQLVRALEQRRRWGTPLPPRFWEPVAHLLTNHLAQSGEYVWSMQLRREAVALDPVMDFLVNVKQGTCERYAAALTLLLRSQGIPARIVKGYRGADYQGEGTYHVLNSHAHAWVEALVPGEDSAPDYDWIVLDPTPDADLGESPSALERLQRSGKILWRDLIVGYNSTEQADLLTWVGSQTQTAIVAAAALVLALLIALRLGRRIGFGHWGRSETGSLYARLRMLLERSARMRPGPNETPAELARRAGTWLGARAATAALAEVPARVVAVHYAMRFGGQTPDENVLRGLSAQLDALAAALPRRS